MESISRLTRFEFDLFKSKSCSVCPNCSTLQHTITFCKWCSSKTINVTDAYLNGLILIIESHNETKN
jgi:hypothetical protein